MKAFLALAPCLASAAVAEYYAYTPGAEAYRQAPNQQDEIPLSDGGSDASSSWPYGPFNTRGRDIVNARGEVIHWAGVNWPSHLESMVPEGLEFKSAANILDDIASVGFNFIRLTYAIEMLDQIYDRGGPDVPLEVAMIEALGYVNGTRVTNTIIANNPGWTVQTTRLEIWSDVARLALARGIFIHPDVHTSSAGWCCSHDDGNAWFDDVHFDVGRWHRGLAHVAAWAAGHPNVVSMSLHNELRESSRRPDLHYDWTTFAGNMTAGADAVHAANPDLLITWSGMQFDQDLSALTVGANLLTAPCYRCRATRDALRRPAARFDLAAHPWADKVVWELHLYEASEDLDTGSCALIQAALYRNGFNALGVPTPQPGCALTADCSPARRLTPVILSEFGHVQGPGMYRSTLQNCIAAFTRAHGVSWAVWSLAGSFRIRSGVQGFADAHGLSNEDWSGWNYPEAIKGYWKPWVAAMNVTTIS